MRNKAIIYITSKNPIKIRFELVINSKNAGELEVSTDMYGLFKNSLMTYFEVEERGG